MLGTGTVVEPGEVPRPNLVFVDAGVLTPQLLPHHLRTELEHVEAQVQALRRSLLESRYAHTSSVPPLVFLAKGAPPFRLLRPDVRMSFDGYLRPPR